MEKLPTILQQQRQRITKYNFPVLPFWVREMWPHIAVPREYYHKQAIKILLQQTTSSDKGSPSFQKEGLEFSKKNLYFDFDNSSLGIIFYRIFRNFHKYSANIGSVLRVEVTLQMTLISPDWLTVLPVMVCLYTPGLTALTSTPLTETWRDGY